MRKFAVSLLLMIDLQLCWASTLLAEGPVKAIVFQNGPAISIAKVAGFGLLVLLFLGNIILGIKLRKKTADLARELAERKQTQKLLRESEDKYRDLFENADEMIYSVGIDGRFLHVNRKWLETLGYSEKEIAGLTIWDIVHPDCRPHCESVFKKIISGERIAQLETLFLSKEGRPIAVEGNASCRLEDGAPVLTRCIFRDVSERKRAKQEKADLEARLQRAQQMEAIGTLAGGVAHDLNNILSGIVSYPELLLMDIKGDSPLRQPLLTIQKSGEKAARIVQDLLTLARRGVAAREVLNINQIISEYIESHEFEQLCKFHPDVQLEKDLDINALNIAGSPVHLSKTIMNLVSNAAEAMPQGGKIMIATQNRYVDRPLKGYDEIKPGEYVVLSVSDSGTGIAAEDQKRIFEPFYTKKTMGRSGTGLGMAVVWGTVKDHGGYIDLQSREGQGTTFELYFPTTGIELSQEPDIPLEDYRGRGESILIVDDVKEQREIASRMLSKLNYAVASAPSGEEAVAYLKNNSADLIILDMIMDPGIDGYETYNKIRAFKPDQKAIIASGYAESGRVKWTQQSGAGGYLKKPYTLEQLGTGVKKELGKT